MTPRSASRAGRRLVRVAGLLLAGLVAYIAVTAIQVYRAAQVGEPAAAQAIVVLGAAQYDGRPSPVLATRLDHVVWLYERGVADVVIVTGGGQPGDRFTEAAASARYLAAHGVPGGRVERETTGDTSYESLAATARFLLADGIDEVVLVSDPWHAYRIASIAREVGLSPQVSPTPTSLYRGWSRAQRLARETAAVALGRVIGYRRLDNLAARLGADPPGPDGVVMASGQPDVAVA